MKNVLLYWRQCLNCNGTVSDNFNRLNQYLSSNVQELLLRFQENLHILVSLLVTDNIHQIEATIYQDEKQYSYLDLPRLHNCVIVVGNSYRKQSSNKSFITKVKVKLYRVISQNQLVQIFQIISEKQKMREEKNSVQNVTTKTKRSILNELKGTIIPVQIRSLILGCVYITLENNLDLNSYTFSWYTIQKHRLTKSYIQSKKLKEEALEYLRQFIDAELKYLSDNKQIQQKEKIQDQTLYVVYRATFVRLEMRILGIINEKKKTGTVLNELVMTLNKEEGFIEEKNFIINENFVQKMLKKFIQESRIYKTSDKVLYPNS